MCGFHARPERGTILVYVPTGQTIAKPVDMSALPYAGMMVSMVEYKSYQMELSVLPVGSRACSERIT